MITTLGLAAGLLLTGAIATHTALAGTYVMRNCNVPGHGNSLLYPWQESERSYSDITTANGCATGSGFAARVGASRQLAYAHGVTIMLMKPPAPRSQIEFVKLMVWYGARLAGTGQPLHFRTSEYRSDGVLRVGLADTAPGSENVIAEHMLSPDTQSVHMSFQCGPWGVAQPEGCTAASHEPWLLRGVEVTLKEDVAPIVLAPTGSLLAGGPQSGSRTVTFSASDAQSGLSKVVVSLGATVVATHDLTPSCPHSDFTVCPASKDATLAIDTRTVANGSHRLTVRAEDAAGNISLVSADAPIEVANAPAAPAAVANAPAAPAPINALKHVLSARFKGTARSTLTVPYGRRVSVSGRLDQGSIRPARFRQRSPRPGVAADASRHADRSS